MYLVKLKRLNESQRKQASAFILRLLIMNMEKCEVGKAFELIDVLLTDISCEFNVMMFQCGAFIWIKAHCIFCKNTV